MLNCGNKEFRKETTLWMFGLFGSSYAYVLDEMEGHTFPCDLYLEGIDQVSRMVSILSSDLVGPVAAPRIKGFSPMGFFVDGEGRKMSKSLGNGIDPPGCY